MVYILTKKSETEAAQILNSLDPVEFTRTASEFKEVLMKLVCPKCHKSGQLRHAEFTASQIYRKVTCKQGNGFGCKQTIGGANLCTSLTNRRTETARLILDNLANMRSKNADSSDD